MLLLALAAGGCGRAVAEGHSCSARDLKFIETATINMTALGEWTADYQRGHADPEHVAREAFDAAERVRHVEPKDPSLRAAQTYLGAMLTEYGEAVSLHAKGRESGDRMYRAYGLANFAHDVLVQAQPELQRRGCDVAPLL